MARDDQALLRAVIRSISKEIEWEPLTPKDDRLRLNLKTQRGQTILEIPNRLIDEAQEDPGMARNNLRERIKAGCKRIRDQRPAYMPWVLPKIEPVGAPGPRPGWGGGGGGRR